MSGLENIEKQSMGSDLGSPRILRLDQLPWFRRGGKILLDTTLAALAWILVAGLDPQESVLNGSMIFFICLALAINLALQLTAQHYRLLDLREAKAILYGDLGLVGVSLAFCLVRGGEAGGGAGRDVFLAASLLCGVLWFIARLIMGSALGHRGTGQEGAGERTLIVGAGRAGLRLCQEVLEHPKLKFKVIGFVDDAPEKHGVRIQGVPVLGSTDRLGEFIQAQKISLVILGLAGAPGARLRELSRELQGRGVKVKTVPGIQELVGDRPWKPEWRDVAIEDLLRREPVTLDTTAIRKALEGSVALITGAGGSIGSELARRVAAFGPRRLVLLGRGENSLWEIERDLARRFPSLVTEVALCDIRDPGRLGQVFAAWRPGVVFHAAAHKHVPYLERHPEEAVGNNIFGTRNVLEAALGVATGVFVNISTDKAVNPVNALGASKRIGEQLVTQAATHAPRGSHFVSVRFGNVLGSDQFFPFLTFDRQPVLKAGVLYHLVFANPHPLPEANFFSVNGIFTASADGALQPTREDLDWAMLYRNRAHPAWVPRRTPGTREGFTPILEVSYAGGMAQGIGYMEFWMGAALPIGGAARVGEVFTVSGPSRQTTAVAVRVRRVRGRGPLAVRLETAEGRPVAEGACPGDDLAVSAPRSLGGCGWLEARFPAPVTLASAHAYRLVLGAAADTGFEAFPMRKGMDKGFTAATTFADGHAEGDDGHGWKGWEQWGQKGRLDSDLQFYFKVKS